MFTAMDASASEVPRTRLAALACFALGQQSGRSLRFFSFRQWMGFKPEDAGGRERIYAGSLPPPLFIAAAMDLTVMAAAERHRELIADFATERTRLRKP